MIEARGLGKSFGALHAVEGLSFQIREGELVGLLGANGAGKTTLLRMLAGMISPSCGEASIAGVDPARAPQEARRRLGYLTSDTTLPPRLTPAEVMTLFGRLHQLPAALLEHRREELTDALALSSFLDRPCGLLSQGERQRASLARALMHDPSALILDEPTSALDVLAARAVLDAVVQAKRRGRAVLFSTHRLSDAELVCDRVLMVHRGQLMAEGSVSALCEEAHARTLTEAYLNLVARREAQVRQ